MDLIHLAIYVVVVAGILGILYWLSTQIPIPPVIRSVIWAIVAIVALLWLLSFLGGAHSVRVP